MFGRGCVVVVLEDGQEMTEKREIAAWSQAFRFPEKFATISGKSEKFWKGEMTWSVVQDPTVVQRRVKRSQYFSQMGHSFL